MSLNRFVRSLSLCSLAIPLLIGCGSASPPASNAITVHATRNTYHAPRNTYYATLNDHRTQFPRLPQRPSGHNRDLRSGAGIQSLPATDTDRVAIPGYPERACKR